MRLNYIRDANAGGTITFSYNGSAYTSLLTKVQSPQGDSRNLILSYDANTPTGKLTKAELKDNSTVLQTVTYAYSSTFLTKVTDNEGKTTQYEYQNQGGSSRMITKVTDKASKVTNLAWYFGDDAGGNWGAYKIEVTDAGSLKSVYDRSMASDVDTMTPQDGGTNLEKAVYTPVSGDASRRRYADSYKDDSNYDRSSFEYNGSSDMTKTKRPGDVTDGTYAYTTTGASPPERTMTVLPSIIIEHHPHTFRRSR